MFDDPLASLNTLLLQHPHLLQVMHTLFWFKSYLLLAIYGIFVYLAFTDRQLNAVQSRGSRKAKPRGVLIA
jgi:hypothetical protein